jgi:putative ABC transport system permease protein
VLRESALLAIAGIVVGTIVSFIARRIILIALPTQRLFWSNEWVLRATALALLGALAGALYPAFKAAGKDPIEALAYE